MDVFQKKILLASKSPRRSELLTKAGFSFERIHLDIEESYPADLPKEEVAEYLAVKKSQAATDYFRDDAVLLTADSIVLLDGVIYEKPQDEADAKRILQQLSGRTHQVITGVCLADPQKSRSFSGISEVHFSTLNAEEIDYYVNTYRPFDKAGAYAIQEWIGLCKIDKIIGTYSNIMGLPMELVYKELLAF